MRITNHITRRLAHPVAIFALSLVAGSFPSVAQDRNSPPSSAQPDNTKTNQSDRQTGAPTADQQKNTRSDRDLAQSIRRSITSDKSLSSYAHNVKVVVQNGTVTLRGPVRSEEERTAVEAKAKEAAGSDVHNEITIAPKQ